MNKRKKRHIKDVHFGKTNDTIKERVEESGHKIDWERMLS